MAKAKDKQEDIFLKKLGERIVYYRKQQNKSQNDIAFECGWDKPNLRKLEKGRGNPTSKTLYTLSKALGIKVKDLFDFE